MKHWAIIAALLTGFVFVGAVETAQAGFIVSEANRVLAPWALRERVGSRRR